MKVALGALLRARPQFPSLRHTLSPLASVHSQRPYHPSLVRNSAKMAEDQAQPQPQEQETKLPPLSAADFRIYNRTAEHMDYFHANFRRSWNILWTATETSQRPRNMTLKQFLSVGIHFAEHLEVHHNIEETYIFPFLARKMPEFQNGKGKRAAELLRQHREIHKGLDGFKEYLEKCSSGEDELRLDVLREKMEGWKDVLWNHLDQEVKTLGAENMRRYWTKEEMAMIPM
ncbi:hypothetical protein BJY04DRAFT_176741 [Aspergillus karnatakaensis]|uniref:hemerythrin domain-containing protein n=1 Tax=Aspergillus karnatakaensis TaxID=1810916 RepID=UPI003CCCB1D1